MDKNFILNCFLFSLCFKTLLSIESDARKVQTFTQQNDTHKTRQDKNTIKDWITGGWAQAFFG